MQITEFFCAAVIKATTIFAAAFLVDWLLRRVSASTRYFLWTGVFAVALTFPAASLAIKPWNVPVSTLVAMAPSVLEADAQSPASSDAPNPGRWLLALWLCGAVAVLGRVAAGHARVWRIIRRSDSVRDEASRAKLAESVAVIGLRRTVDLRWSTETDVPIGYGLARPVVLLPAQSKEWDQQRLGVVLLHELTHIRRMDSLARLLEQIVRAAYWFHPLAWLAAAHFRREQERSCDDAVIAAGIGRSDYAAHLVALAGSLSRSAIGMAEASGLEQRVRALLDSSRTRRPLSRAACVAAIAALIAAAIPLAAVRAQNSGSISGSVYDPSGAVVPIAVVRLTSVNSTNEEIAHADAAGVYRFANIPSGKYDLQVSAPGFKIFTRTAMEITGNATANIRLELGEINETIEVLGRGSAQVPHAAATPNVIEVGGRVQAAKLMSQVPPVYPPAAQSAGIEGTVVLRAIISEQGTAPEVQVASQSADDSLVQAAIDAVKQWRYAPTLLNGHPVKVLTTITVNFKLQ